MGAQALLVRGPEGLRSRIQEVVLACRGQFSGGVVGIKLAIELFIRRRQVYGGVEGRVAGRQSRGGGRMEVL